MPGPVVATLLALLVALVVAAMEKPPLFLAAVFGQFAVYVLAALFISCLAAIIIALVMLILKRHHQVAPLQAYPALVIIISLLVLLTAYLNKEEGRSILSMVPLPERHQHKVNDLLAEAHGLASRSLDNSSTGKWQIVDETPKTAGDLGHIERLMKRWSNQLATIKNEHLTSMESIGYDTLLSPVRLAGDTDFSQSKRMIGQVRESLERQQGQLLELADSAPRDIDKLPMSTERKLAARTAYRDGAAKGLKVLHVLAEVDSEIIDEQEKYIQLLAARRGFWQVVDGKIVFTSDKDKKACDAHVLRIRELTQKQGQTIQQTVEQALRDMERYSKP